MAGLKPLKKPTRKRKALKREDARRSTMGPKAKSGTFGLYESDPGYSPNRRRAIARRAGGHGAYGTEKGNISYRHRGETVKKTTKARKKPGPKKR